MLKSRVTKAMVSIAAAIVILAATFAVPMTAKAATADQAYRDAVFYAWAATVSPEEYLNSVMWVNAWREGYNPLPCYYPYYGYNWAAYYYNWANVYDANAYWYYWYLTH